jgi:hypothetical protein
MGVTYSSAHRLVSWTRIPRVITIQVIYISNFPHQAIPDVYVQAGPADFKRVATLLTYVRLHRHPARSVDLRSPGTSVLFSGAKQNSKGKKGSEFFQKVHSC